MSALPASDSDVSFSSLGVPAPITKALDRQGITAPFEIQRETIPDALAGRDVLGRAPTGSGKTLAFGIPLLAGLGQGGRKRPRGLILSPTRELAEQIRRELEPLADAVGRTILTVYGGVGFGAQLKGLRAGADLLVACPGRLEDLISQGEVSLAEVDSIVVDEADRMADMGFLPAVRRLLDLTADERQTVLFSATLDNEVQVLIDKYQTDPVTHEVGEVEPDLSAVDHRFIVTENTEKLRLAADLIEDTGPTMIFCRTRHGVDRVARQLKRAGVKAAWIHGGRSQNQRNAALHAFTTAKVQALVATDVAARGIHVDGVAQVIHYDPPADHKDYIHRSGRTARAGAGGVVVSFVNQDQRKPVGRLIKQVGLPPTEFETTPPLREREAPAWENRNARNGGQNGSGQGGSGQGGSGQSGSGGDGRYKGGQSKRKPASKQSSSSKSRADKSRADKSGPGPNARSEDERTERGERPARQSNRRPSSAKQTSRGSSDESRSKRSSADGRPTSGGKPKAGGKPKSGGKPKAGGKAKAKASKRSGRSRPKNKRGKGSTSTSSRPS